MKIQNVFIGQIYSNYTNILIGVPQGTVLGLVLFFIYLIGHKLW